jgi:hypothetical protein
MGTRASGIIPPAAAEIKALLPISGFSLEAAGDAASTMTGRREGDLPETGDEPE